MADERSTERVKVYEQRKGRPWWLLLLPLLAIPLLLWWFNRGDDDRGVARNTETEQEARTGAVGGAGAAATGDELTDFLPVYGAENRGTYANRRVNVSDASVQRVLSDRMFTVGNGSGRELFVMLDSSLDAGGAENRVQIRPGQRLSMTGTLMAPPSAETRAERLQGLAQGEADQLMREQVYVHATRVSGAR